MKKIHLGGSLLVVVGALGVAAAGFLPWGASGRRERSSYELVAIAERLDVLDGTGAVVARGWYLAPLVAAGSWLAAAAGRRGVSHALAAVVAGGGTVLALAVRASPVEGPSGPYVTIGAAMVVGAGLVAARVGRTRSHG